MDRGVTPFKVKREHLSILKIKWDKIMNIKKITKKMKRRKEVDRYGS